MWLVIEQEYKWRKETTTRFDTISKISNRNICHYPFVNIKKLNWIELNYDWLL